MAEDEVGRGKQYWNVDSQSSRVDIAALIERTHHEWRDRRIDRKSDEGSIQGPVIVVVKFERIGRGASTVSSWGSSSS